MDLYTLITIITTGLLSFAVGVTCGTVIADLFSGVKTSQKQDGFENARLERYQLQNERIRIDNAIKTAKLIKDTEVTLPPTP